MPEFAEMTRRVIAKDGFDGYLPTLLVPERRHLVVLEGVPEHKLERIQEIAVAWAGDKTVADEEYFLAFRVDADHFRIVHRRAGCIEEQDFLAAASHE